MSQQISPWLEGSYGWNFGENNWNSGMDTNLLKFSFMFDRNVDSITAALPAAVNGQAHYLTTDNRLYFAVGTTYFSTVVPKWFTIIVRSTGDTWQYNGSVLAQIESISSLDTRLSDVELTISSLGTAAFEDISAFATSAQLDILGGQAQSYTDTLRQDLSDTALPSKGAGQVGRSAQVVESIAALRLLDKTAVSKDAFVSGYYVQGDGGGGTYYLDEADVISADNGGDIIVAADGGRWKMSRTNAISVKQFGAKGDGIADDTSAIQSAFNSLPSGGGKLNFPAGKYNYTQLVFDGAIGLSLVGDGAITTTELICTSSAATDGIKLRSTFDCTASFITFNHSLAAFTGYLVELNHKPASSIDTQGMYFFRCTFASVGFDKYTAKGLNLDQATVVSFEGCKFGSLLRPVDGQLPTGGSYSNVVRFVNCQSADNIGYFANFLGEHWVFENCNFQPCSDGAHRIAFSDNTTSWRNLSFINCSTYDATAAGTSALLLGNGQCLTVHGGLWGGRNDLGSSTFLGATGAIIGISVKSAAFLLFTNVYSAASAGSAAWDLSGGSQFVSCTNIFTGAGNVTGISLDLNTPNSSLGTLPITSGANSLRYNQDGSIEMTGSLAVTAGSTETVTFPIAAFPTACWDVQVTLQNPAATSNVVSIGSLTAASFPVFINGSGSSTVRWRAVGK